jgi:hypothetical protein
LSIQAICILVAEEDGGFLVDGTWWVGVEACGAGSRQQEKADQTE